MYWRPNAEVSLGNIFSIRSSVTYHRQLDVQLKA